MITTVKLREEAAKTNDQFVSLMYHEAADTIEELCKQIDGCVRVAANALRDLKAKP